jgi:hypothetical protein|tara:strand:- start:1986 stop:2237 length:252 start_codon:yes stop_codon:yes gene_type:complete
MQKIVNVISIFSGVVSITLVGATGYVYLNRASIIEGAKENIIKAATQGVTDALPGIVDSSMPELPASTGGISGLGGSAIPFGK